MWNLCLGLGSVTARVCDLGHVTSHFWAWIASKAGELGLCHYNFRSNFKFKKKYFFADMMMECLMSTATCLQGNFIWTREPVIGGGIWASVREMILARGDFSTCHPHLWERKFLRLPLGFISFCPCNHWHQHSKPVAVCEPQRPC